jgi:GMP synthase (glutamine-hydrolysing)
MILILDFGSQYTQLIARNIREMKVYCELHPYDTREEKIKAMNPRGIILSGGPETVTAEFTPRAPQLIFALGCPVLGICYGMQTMALQLGGKVGNHLHSEFGHAHLLLLQENNLLDQKCRDVWMSHGDQVTTLPPHFTAIAKTDNTAIAAMENAEKSFYGLQFHPEVTHTPQGKTILQKFVLDICRCEQNWMPQNIIEKTVKSIAVQVKKDKVLLGLSGGVDSLVAAMLLKKAIGDQLICMYIDHGLQRLNEAESLTSQDLNVIQVNAKEKFLSALKHKVDPEEKRKIVGKLFIDVFTEEAKKIKGIKWLAQGTIYSDVIESVGIKSHHNAGGLPENLSLPLIEPLRELFKDEVRKIGLNLGLPYDSVYRHPFPGPGLSVRVLGEVTEEALTSLRKADYIFLEELHRAKLYQTVSQAFCVYLPVSSVGVVGDARQYAPIIALRAVESRDFMTATSAALPHEFLQYVARRIVNEVKNISRVVYDVTSKPPATIEWE